MHEAYSIFGVLLIAPTNEFFLGFFWIFLSERVFSICEP
jgi:hypothetical protein